MVHIEKHLLSPTNSDLTQIKHMRSEKREILFMQNPVLIQMKLIKMYASY